MKVAKSLESNSFTLSLPEKILEKLQREKETFAYANIQEVIVETLRKKYFGEKESASEKKSGTSAKKVNEANVLSRDKIFDKDGIALDL